MDLCRSNKQCYSFNYDKTKKWCYLGNNDLSELKRKRYAKYTAGYRLCVEQSNNNSWVSDVRQVAGTPTGVSGSVIGGNTWSATWLDGNIPGNPEETYTVKCVELGAPCLAQDAVSTIPAVGIARNTQSGQVTGLVLGANYTCYIAAVNNVGTICSDATNINAVRFYNIFSSVLFLGRSY